MAATFMLDPDTLRAVQDLKVQLGVTSDEAVIQKALALAKVASTHADGNSNITISSSSGKETLINLKE